MLDEVCELVLVNTKISNAEKKHIKMQITNLRKNICYKRGEYQECLDYLKQQLEAIGENEV